MSRNRRKFRDLTLTLVCRTTLPRHHHADVLPFPAQPRQHPAIEETSRSVTAPTGIYFRPPADDGPPRARAEGSRRRRGAAVGVARQRKSTFTTAPSAGPADYFSARADRRGGDSAARRRFTTVTQTLRGQLHGRTATGRARRRAIWSLPTGARACVCVCVCAVAVRSASKKRRLYVAPDLVLGARFMAGAAAGFGSRPPVTSSSPVAGNRRSTVAREKLRRNDVTQGSAARNDNNNDYNNNSSNNNGGGAKKNRPRKIDRGRTVFSRDAKWRAVRWNCL